MQNNENNVPFIVYEGTITKLEYMNKRLFYIIVFLIVALIATNSLWISYEMQYQDITLTQEVKQRANSDSGNAYNINSYGTGDADNKNDTQD